MALRLEVCRTGDVPPGEVRAFEVDGLAIPVLVANVSGRFLATSGICPHEDVELIDGDLADTRIICPGHGYAFDLASGRCSHDPALRLPTYPVVIDGGAVFIVVAGPVR